MSASDNAVRRVQRAVGWLSFGMGGLATICVVTITVVTLAEVFRRYFFGQSFLGVVELVELLVSFVFFALMSYTQLRKAHLRLTLFTDHLGPRTALSLESVVLLLIFIFISVMLWQATSEAMISTARQQTRFGAVAYPIWPAKIAAAMAVAVMGLQVLVDFIDRVLALRKGGDVKVQALGQAASEADSV